MTNPPDTAPAAGPKVFGVKVGNTIVTGLPAILVVIVLLAFLAALVVWAHPSTGMLFAGAIWAGFLVFWTLTARPSGATQSRESTQSRAVHSNLMRAGLIFLFVPVPGLQARYLTYNPWHVPVGLGVMVLATLLHTWARVHLGRNWSGEVMIKVGHQLVRSGPYRIVRHPIYTAILGLAFGTALVSARGLSLFGAALIAGAYVRKLRQEEVGLAGTFGTEWAEFVDKTWALLPPIY